MRHSSFNVISTNFRKWVFHIHLTQTLQKDGTGKETIFAIDPISVLGRTGVLI